MAHEQFKEMLTTHALSALDRGDELELEEHLATCQECLKELDEWRATAAAMAFAGAVAEPSPKVRERLLAQIKTERAGSESESRRTVSPSNVVPLVSPRKNVRSPMGSLLAIAASLIVGVLLISLFLLWRDNRSMREEMARLSRETESKQAELKHEREINEFLTRPGARTTELAGTKVAPQAYARIAYDKSGQAMLMAKGLPEAPAGKAYQLWFIVGDNKMPGRTFKCDEKGQCDMRDEIPAAALSGAVFAVTLEPMGGVKAPTGDIFLVSGS